MIAVVIGGTGMVGTILVQKLLNDKDFLEVVSISRTALSVSTPKLKEVILTDLSKLPSQAPKLKGDVYFCCLGTTIKAAGNKESFRSIDFDAIVHFAQIARDHQAQAFLLVSATGANTKSMIFYNQVKGETEEAIEKLNFKSLVIFRPSLLMGERKEFRLGEKMASKIAGPLSILMPIKLRKMLVTEAEELAQAMIRQAKKPHVGISVIKATEI